MSFKILSGALAAPLFSGAKAIYAISEEGIMGNIHVKSFQIWTSESGDVVSRKSFRTKDDLNSSP